MTDEQSFDEDPQLRDLLGQADPARSLTPADPDGMARLLRQIQEDPMHDTLHEVDTPAPESAPAAVGSARRGRLTWLAGAAAVAVIAGGGFAVASSLGDDEPSVPQAGQTTDDAGSSDGTSPDTPTESAEPVTLEAPTFGAKCAVPTPELLAQFDTAFSGTVTSVDGGVVTLAPTEVYAGEVQDAQDVEILGAGGPGPRAALGGLVDFEVGQTYYVAASGGQVSACGFSGPTSSSQLEQLYGVAFR